MEAELVGKKIVKVRQMIKIEMEQECWQGKNMCLELDDGTIIYPSQDEEGNGPGALFGCDKKGQTVMYWC